jgi:hypothetical protein
MCSVTSLAAHSSAQISSDISVPIVVHFGTERHHTVRMDSHKFGAN